MIELRRSYGLLLLTGIVLLAGCKKQERSDHCKNHYLFHADHLESVATLDVDLDPGGLVEAKLNIPMLVFDAGGDSAATDLRQNDTAIELKTEHACEAGNWDVQSNSETMQATFQSRCGENNSLDQVNVNLLDIIPGLDEIVVTVTTPATSKHFAISRQCSSAIFRIDPPAGRAD